MSWGAKMRIALTVGGSDSGGGAGVQADLKTFASIGVHGVSAVTCLTAQNPRGVLGIQSATSRMVVRQLEAIFAELPPAAAKTGMLYSASIIERTADFFSEHRCPLVVDPVMVSTSGAQLLKTSAVKALTTRLLPLCTLMTPNLDEASLLAGRELKSIYDLRAAAREFHGRFGCAVLMKGGHLRGLQEAVDIFYDGSEELLLASRFIRNVSTHGTGCTYSAAIVGYLARGYPMPKALGAAKEYITQAIACGRNTGNHSVLNNFWAWPRSGFNPEVLILP